MNTKVLQNFGKNLKRYRKLAGLTQEDLAFKTGYDQTYIAKIELGKANPTIKLLFIISRALGIKLYNLFDFDK
ncbi:MAG: helix-turn-helix domain-containing protein [Candidatus Gastranaerophilales bacterium]|nr:helix-turn-helix domain-containing protein [Candidatus Gastranaerophilales bacterium]